VAEILALAQSDFDDCKLKDKIWDAVIATRGESPDSDLSGETTKAQILFIFVFYILFPLFSYFNVL
jgi:hypothetical protein